MQRRWLTLTALVSLAMPLTAQRPRPVFTPDSVTIVADSSFARSGLSRWLLGATYRELWTAPVRVEVLDLDRFAGGLSEPERSGRLQTRSLRFRGANGRLYQFRLVRKDLNPTIWKGYEGSLAEKLARDQLSALHPAGVLVVPVLLEAIGALHAAPVLRVMPDDPRLGEFREEFAHALGTIEERPDGERDEMQFADAARVEDTEGLLQAIRERPSVRVDTRALLAVRLVDLMVGDFDRHHDQYYWALLGEGRRARWKPISRDRDYAFVHYDGAALRVGRMMAPTLVTYDETYDSPSRATRNGRFFDRRMLTDLEAPVWDSVARAVQSRITDAVIDKAVKRLPPEYERRNGATLRRVLRARRDGLPEMARRFYAYLADVVIIDGGDVHDRIAIDHLGDGRTRVRISEAGVATPYFDRTFRQAETKEVRIYLRNGADHATVTGTGAGPRVRLVGGEGPDSLVDESNGSRVRFYDEDRETSAPDGRLDARPYVPPDTTDIPQFQDWGGSLSPSPRLQTSSHSGLALGVELRLMGYGFRSHPYATLHTVSVDYSLRRNSFRFRGSTRWRRENSPVYFGFTVLASAIEGGRFFGFGNETVNPGDSDRFIVLRKAYEVSPYIGFGLESRTRLWLMLRARHTITDLRDSVNLASIALGRSPPAGTGDAGKLGPAARFEYDSRDTRMAPRSGIHARFDAEYNPVDWSNGEGPFGSLEGSVSTYLTPVSPVTLALRVGGRQVWGDFPYFEAAYLGGNRSLRGFPSGRFAGDRSVFGNAELRLRVLENRWLVPVEIGLLGLADAGRVWFDGESPGGWHTDLGAGLWFSALERSQGLSLGLARSPERGRFWFTLGMPF